MTNPCIKSGYASKGEATKEAHKAHIFAKPYLCWCGKWHLSSGATKQKESYKKTTKRGGKRCIKIYGE